MLDPDFPKTGWHCMDITDLGAPKEICELCGHQIIRYVHHMYHQETGRTMDCGCICAGKLEGDIEKAQKREASFKNKKQRKLNFLKKTWKRSARGHEYLKIKNHLSRELIITSRKKINFYDINIYRHRKTEVYLLKMH